MIQNDELTPIAPLIAAAQIRFVRLVEAQTQAHIRQTADVPQDATMTIAHSASLAQPPDAKGEFLIHATIDLRIQRPEASAAPLVGVKGVFELTYHVPEGFNTSAEELGRFAALNGVFNAWPYFREFVQAMMARMDLPPITLPLYRVAPRPATRGDAGSAGAPASRARPKRKKTSRARR